MERLIVIGLGTKNRPNMLSDALRSLQGIKVPQEARVHLVVCENGPINTGAKVIEKFAAKLQFETTYLSEEKEGIVFMRNKILSEAVKLKADFMVFFDDDETVSANWLVELFDTAKRFSADVVQGHVEQLFPGNTNSDLIKKFFPGSFPNETGDLLDEAYTNNVLFDFSWVKEHGVRFHERFNLTGGSDSFFFMTLKQKGAKIVFSKEAVVTEKIPETRASIEWVLSRFYRNGYSNYLMNVEWYGKLKAFRKGVKVTFKAFRKYGFKKKVGSQIETEKDMLEMKKCLRAKGMFHAMLGLSFSEYHITHGN